MHLFLPSAIYFELPDYALLQYTAISELSTLFFWLKTQSKGQVGDFMFFLNPSTDQND